MTTSAKAAAPSASAGLDQLSTPAVPAMTPRRSVVPAVERGDREREHEHGLDEHRERQVSARSLEREAVGNVPGCGGDGEAGEREQSGERQGVVPDAPAGRLISRRHEQDRGRQRGGNDEWRKPVEERRPLDIDRALPPQAA